MPADAGASEHDPEKARPFRRGSWSWEELIMKFNRIALAATAYLAVAGVAGIASAEMTKMVGGAAMYPSKNIIENAVNSKDHTTLVAAVKAAGLVDTLEGAGPF